MNFILKRSWFINVLFLFLPDGVDDESAMNEDVDDCLCAFLNRSMKYPNDVDVA